MDGAAAVEDECEAGLDECLAGHILHALRSPASWLPLAILAGRSRQIVEDRDGPGSSVYCLRHYIPQSVPLHGFD